MGRYLDLCSTVEADTIEPARPRDISAKSDQSPSASEIPNVNHPIIEGGGKKSTSVEWTPQDWRDHFEERAAIIVHDGELPRPEAERQALEATIIHWMNLSPPPILDDDHCAQCGKPVGRIDNDSVPFLAGGDGHVWLHHGCHAAWMASRRREATEAINAMGIACMADV